MQPVAVDRLNRDEFYARLAPLDEAGLRKALWTLYWRGSAPVRERVLAVVDPQSVAVEARVAVVDAEALLAEVEEFAALARHGSYMAGDRRVSPKERTRWRFTFQRLVKATTRALEGRDVEAAASAMATLIDLACELASFDYFRSDDPVEVARFVVSDAAAVMWSAVRRSRDSRPSASVRPGAGAVGVALGGLAGPTGGLPRGRQRSPRWCRDAPHARAWGLFAVHYVQARDNAGAHGRGTSGVRRNRRAPAEDLAEWHTVLRERLAHGEYEHLLERLS